MFEPHDLKNLWKGIVQHMMGVLGRYRDRGWFYSCLVSGLGQRGLKCCWNNCNSNFSFPNEFIIVLPCGLLVANNTFLKLCIFKMSYWLQ